VFELLGGHWLFREVLVLPARYKSNDNMTVS